jgi:KipI family sensor histidine kinase inhibitor
VTSGGSGRLRFLPAGTRALLVEIDVPDTATALDAAAALYAEIERRRATGWTPSLTDVVPGARTVLLDGVDDVAGCADEIRSWSVPPVLAGAGPVVEIPCVYDGPDLEAVAAVWGVAPDEVAGVHVSRLHRVAFCGFAPGFAYLSGIGEHRSVPRRRTPRPRVPAGSVAVAGAWTGVYPRPSPGGWNLVGRTDVVLWDIQRQPPALLQPGDRVRFVAVGPDDGGPSQ